MFYKLIIVFVIILYIIYLIQVLCQELDIDEITDKQINLYKALIPFYYWFN